MDKRGHLERLRGDSEWVERFMSKIKEADGPLKTPCWEWQGGLDRAGYGRGTMSSTARRRVDVTLLTGCVTSFTEAKNQKSLFFTMS